MLDILAEIMAAAQHDESIKGEISDIKDEGDVLNIMPVLSDDDENVAQEEIAHAAQAHEANTPDIPFTDTMDALSDGRVTKKM